MALLVAGLSAIYSRRAAKAAIKANDIGRLNALLALRIHYLELMEQNQRIGETLKGMQGAENAYAAYAELDSRLREVNREIDTYHKKVVESKI